MDFAINDQIACNRFIATLKKLKMQKTFEHKYTLFRFFISLLVSHESLKSFHGIQKIYKGNVVSVVKLFKTGPCSSSGSSASSWARR